MKVRQTVDAMFDQLKEQIREIPPQDYVACRSFLQSLSYAATKTELNETILTRGAEHEYANTSFVGIICADVCCWAVASLRPTRSPVVRRGSR